MRVYTKKQQQYRTRWHKEYNKLHDYSIDGKRYTGFTGPEEYLIWNKRLAGGRILTDVEIAKFLQRSLQSIQLKRHKMKKQGGM